MSTTFTNAEFKVRLQVISPLEPDNATENIPSALTFPLKVPYLFLTQHGRLHSELSKVPLFYFWIKNSITCSNSSTWLNL